MPRAHDPPATQQHAWLASRTRFMISLLVLSLLLYIVTTQISGLEQSLRTLGQADILYVAVAALAVAATYATAAGTYCLLAVKPLPYPPTLLIQIASGLVNRLLPAGLGGLGINLGYLKKRGYSLSTATAIVTINNILGLIGNALLVGITVVVFADALPKLVFPKISIPLIMLAILVSAALFIILKHKAFRVVLRKSWGEVFVYIRFALDRRGRTALALCSSMLLTSLHAAALYFVSVALGIDIAWAQALVVISLGAVGGALLPTPGGLGGTEAGLLAGLVAYGIPPETGLAAVFLYRGLTYWMPLLPGLLAFRVAVRKYL